MALLPEQDELAIIIGENMELVNPEDQPSRTYKIDFSSGRIGGYIDGIEAVKQAIHKIVHTERFAYLIYSWNYGIELNSILGHGQEVLESELRRVITEALLADARITDVTDVQINMLDKRTAAVEFTAVSIFGNVSVSEEVSL